MTFPILPSNTANTGYNLTRSLRSRASASVNLGRTGFGAGNQKTWTLSTWVKRGTLGSAQALFNTGVLTTSDSTYANIGFTASDTFNFGAYTVAWRNTNQVFRDPSAWYHIIVAFDTTQATASNRVKIYVNGSQVTSFAASNDPTINSNAAINQAAAHYIGYPANAFGYFDGYLAEVNFIDGQALTPSSFGSTNSTTGVWQPAKYTGTYGTNGFYLPFTDNSALTTSSNVGLGKDFSGNGNYWTTNNISITAGVTYDSMTDVPTLTSSTAANFAVLNPVTRPAGVGAAFVTSGGNLNCAVAYVGADSTIAMSSGKWYWEVIPTSNTASNNPRIGIVPSNHGTYTGTSIGDPAGTYGYASTGQKGTGGTYTSYGASFTDNDVIGVALDMTAGTLVFYKNGVSQGTAFTGLTGEFFASVGTGSSTTMNLSFNFGQRPFSYTPPSGFVALNTYNLPDSTIKQGNKVMDATLYTGNLAGQVITNAATFQPDLVWVKSRSAATDNKLTDSVRGATKALVSNSTAAETTDITGVVSFNSNGFTLGTSTTYNNLAATYVGWQWQAGAGSSSSNTNGTITSTVSVNASAGFSIQTFTCPASGNFTWGHGLGVAPAMYIVKSRSTSGDHWGVYHQSMTSLPQSSFMQLDTTSAVISSSTVWANTNPTSSVISMGTNTICNPSDTAVCYAWAAILGFSAFGSLTMNGTADNAFVYCGFKPKFILFKSFDSVGDWVLIDTSRDPLNVASHKLFPDTSGTEDASVNILDVLSNGFKIRAAYNGNWIYAAFASNPFKNSLAQ